MKKEARYQIIIAVLSLIVLIQLLFLFLIIRTKKIIPPLPAGVKGKIAIVLDDWGYNLNTVGLLSQFKHPLTMAVLPNLTFSRQVAEKSHDLGFEVILHLPMEPQEKSRLEKKTIMVDYSDEAILNILKQGLENIPYVAGVSNHMGSRASENNRLMAVIFKELKKRNLYFLDSFSSPRSVGSNLAKITGVRFTRRDVFLDNKEDSGYIKMQLFQLKNKAALYGSAIGIGHDRPLTLEALKETIPLLEKDGYRFVFVSELVK